MALLQIIYTSRPTVLLDDDALHALVVKSGTMNRKLGITGFLYCSPEAYLQVLEGDEKAVLLLYADILRDERHDRVNTVVIRPIDKPDFPNWSMGLLEATTTPIDFDNILRRDRGRVCAWNDADWPSILNTFRAELA